MKCIVVVLGHIRNLIATSIDLIKPVDRGSHKFASDSPNELDVCESNAQDSPKLDGGQERIQNQLFKHIETPLVQSLVAPENDSPSFESEIMDDSEEQEGLTELYPMDLLPKINYQKKFDIDNLSREANFLRVAEPEDDENELDRSPNRKPSIEEIIPNFEKDWPFALDLSLNLFGPFKHNYIRFKLEREFGLYDDWNGPGDCIESVSQDQYSLIEGRRAIFIPLEGFHKVKIAHPTRKVKGFDSDLQIEYQIEFEHKPTKANYWHCQFLFRDHNSQPIRKNNKSAWKEDFVKNHFKSYLKQRASFMIPSETNVIKEIYLLPEEQ